LRSCALLRFGSEKRGDASHVNHRTVIAIPVHPARTAPQTIRSVRLMPQLRSARAGPGG